MTRMMRILSAQVLAAAYSCGLYGAGAYGTGDCGVPVSSGSVSWFDWLLFALSVALLIAIAIWIIKRIIRRRRQAVAEKPAEGLEDKK